VAQLNVKLSTERLEALRRYAARRRTPVTWLIKDYVDYLLSGGKPVVVPDADAPTSDELSLLTQHGGAFDWLAEEPDIYSADDGEPL
jgi:hypothetical protein